MGFNQIVFHHVSPNLGFTRVRITSKQWGTIHDNGDSTSAFTNTLHFSKHVEQENGLTVAHTR